MGQPNKKSRLWDSPMKKKVKGQPNKKKQGYRSA